MTSLARGMERSIGRVVTAVDGRLNRLYGSRYNPLHHTGALVGILLLVLIVTGVYLLVFYRIGSPYDSTAAISGQAWSGRWIRSLHRFSSDAAVVFIVIHATKMFVQSRGWGPRALAWVSGVLLFGVFMICGWTGYVLVWDTQAHVLASEGARVLDALPILSESLSRTFVGERSLPNAFFFMNLFLHSALPMGMGVLFWVHLARVSRPRLVPPRPVWWGVVGALTVVSIVWPIRMAPQADLFTLPGEAPFDIFFSIWLPVVRGLPPGVVWLVVGAIVLSAVLVPLWTRPPRERRPLPAVVDERACTGCEQCSLDCPYEAITMVPRTDGRETLVALVDPDLCVSCGICAGSCAPMVVGPPERTGRDQLAGVKRFIAERKPGADDVVLIGCTAGAGGVTAMERFGGAMVMPVQCAGSLHTSVVEYLIRSGAGGVLIASCPVHDCRNREGGKWLEARLFHEREAELQARVDRRRVRWVEVSAAERKLLQYELAAFRDSIVDSRDTADEEIDIIALCERTPDEVAP